MADTLLNTYNRLVLGRPWLSLLLVFALVGVLASNMDKLKIDASADSLMLRGDPSLEFYRQVSKTYATEDFMLITWQPKSGLLDDASLAPLKAMADELRALQGVSSVLTVLDVPLLESPPVTLSDITSADPLPSLADSDIDRSLALKEFTTSPIYANLLASSDGRLSAVQINLVRDDIYYDLLYSRDELRQQRANTGLSIEQAEQLAGLEAAFRAHTASQLEASSTLVKSVRDVADKYRSHADLFVGGVPMIAADMVSFVRSDLVSFGAAILGIMVLVLSVIFRRLRWVVIPVVTCLTTATAMLGLLGLLDWRMTVISSNFVALLLIISLAISIHLVVRYRELHALDPDGDLHARVLRTVQLMAVPCFYTGVTTIVAFVSLVVSGIQPVIDFGWMMTVGISIAMLLTFILVPCMMLLWPQTNPERHTRQGDVLTLYFARFADRHGAAVLWGAGLLALVSVYGISRLVVENRFIDYFHESTEIYQGMELLDAELGGTIPLDIILTPPVYEKALPGLEPASDTAVAAPVAEDDPFFEDDDPFASRTPAPVPTGDEDDWGDEGWDDDFDAGFESGDPARDTFEPSYWFSLEGMERLDSVHGYLDSRPETGKVLSLSTVFAVVKDLLGNDISSVELALVQRSLPEDIKGMMLDPYFDAGSEQARISLRVMETSKELRRDAFLKSVRAQLVDELGFEEEQVQFTGMLVLYNNVLQSLFQSQILTLAAVFAAIMMMFLILFRSLPLALIGLAPNLLAAGLVLGVMGLTGIPLDIMTITIAAIVVGMGVDNCIHYIHRFMREFPVDRDYRATMFRCHGSIGRALYYTTVTVVVGFSTLVLSNFNPSIYFGLLTVLAMAAAVIGALLLLPLLILWWQPLGPDAAAQGAQA